MADQDGGASGASGVRYPGELEPLDAETERERAAHVEACQRRAQGVLHLGAHTGQERHAYARRDLPVLWVEAHPLIFRRLVANLDGFDDQQALCGVLADVDDRQVDFGRSATMSGESSSIYEFGPHAHALWPDHELHMIERLRLPTVTLDSLLSNHGIAPGNYDFWVVDLQGAELPALQGAEASLRACAALLVEVSTVEVYRGSPLWPEVRDFLRARHFAPAWSPARPHDDVLFVRDGHALAAAAP